IHEFVSFNKYDFHDKGLNPRPSNVTLKIIDPPGEQKGFGEETWSYIEGYRVAFNGRDFGTRPKYPLTTTGQDKTVTINFFEYDGVHAGLLGKGSLVEVWAVLKSTGEEIPVLQKWTS
ncbi:hypothetical protein ACLBXI_29905, partial [Bacillus cereus]